MKISATSCDRAKAAEIAAREEHRAKRSKLGAHLLQRLQQKHKRAYSKAILSRAITAYLDSSPAFVDAWTDLRKLDIVVERISPTLGDFVQEKKRASSANSESVASLLCCDDSSADVPGSTNANDVDKEAEFDEAIWREINPWVKMSLAKSVEGELSDKAASQMRQEKRDTMANNLNEQIWLKQLADDAKRKEDEKFVAAQKRETEGWHEQAELQRQRDEEARKNAAENIKSQISEQQERKRVEQELCRARERQEIDEMKCKLQLEEDRQRQAKEAEKLTWEKIKAENEVKLQYRERLKEEEAALDAKLMAEMKARLDAEEAARARALADRLKRNEEFVQKLKEAEQWQQGEDRRIEEERAVLKEMEAREQRERELERRKREMQKKRQESIIETNRQMTESKKAALLEIEQEEEKYAAKCRQEAEALLEEERQKQARRAQLKKQNSTLLKKQIEEEKKARKVLMSDMNAVECSINKAQVKKIEENPEIKRRILEMVTSNSPPLGGIEGASVVGSEE